MAEQYRHDPVSAISEAEATGEAAAIFADIRATMQIPLITSIWRTLYDVEGGLRAAWNTVKPVYQTGLPAASLARLLNAVELTVPKSPISKYSSIVDGLPSILPIVDAYNRSNGMNMIALTALFCQPSGSPPEEPVAQQIPAWPELTPLLPKAEISLSTWSLIETVSQFGATPGGFSVPTLWRHLAHWPALLEAIVEELTPLQADGTIQQSLENVFQEAQVEGAHIANMRSEPVMMPDGARHMIEYYVGSPNRVGRMVTLGHGLAKWLRQTNPSTI